MMEATRTDSNLRPLPDKEFVTIADYVMKELKAGTDVVAIATDCLMDALGCAFMALKYPACTRLIGPVVPGTIVPSGSRVPGTDLILDPVTAAFSIGTLIRWLDFNDTWLAAEWGHPSDNLGAILAVCDHLSRLSPQKPLRVKDILTAMIKAYEIQGVLALENSLNRVGLDHVAFVKTASAAVIMPLLGGGHSDVIDVLSQVWVDGQSLRTYRHAPNTGPRKSWAAGDATRRATQLALMVRQGQPGYASALTAKTWGFYDVSFHGQPFKVSRPYASYVMENILFKISWPAEFHAQTAVECAIQLHHAVKHRLSDIVRIELTTHESAIRIISKTGELHNPADRDHCLQYMVAVALLFGNLSAESYEDAFAADPRIDTLREKMTVSEDLTFSRDYLDPEKRSIANAIQIFFQDGSSTEQIRVEYPLGHRRRRQEGRPLLLKKFNYAVTSTFEAEQAAKIEGLFADPEKLQTMPVHEFMAYFCVTGRTEMTY